MKRTTIAAFVSLISLSALEAPAVAAGGTGGHLLDNAGLWTYGITGSFHYPEGPKAHGLNEKVPVQSLYDAHEFQYRLGKKLGRT